jgi:hypothetical protein
LLWREEILNHVAALLHLIKEEDILEDIKDAPIVHDLLRTEDHAVPTEDLVALLTEGPEAVLGRQ